MKKKLYAFIIGSISLVGSIAGVYSLTSSYGYLVQNKSIAYDQSEVLDLYENGVTDVSAQIAISSDILTTSTFTDGSQSTFSLTVNDFESLIEKRSTGSFTISSNTALAGSKASNSISIVNNSALSGSYASNSITVADNSSIDPSMSITYHGVSYKANNSWYIGQSSIATANSIALFFNISGFGLSASTTSNGVVTLTMNHIGTQYNKYELSASTPFTVGSSSFTGGDDAASITFNGLVFATDYSGNANWTVTNFASMTAINLARKLNQAVYGVSASTTGTGSTVTLTCDNIGEIYNSYILTSSTPTALKVSNSSFTGGTDNAYISINNVKLYNTYDWLIGRTASDTAKNIYDLIVLKPALSDIIQSSWTAGGILNVTAISTGNNYNYSLYSSTPAGIVISGNTMLGRGQNGIVRIGKSTLKQGSQWLAGTSTSLTAKSISDAIMSDSYLKQVIRSTWVANVVYSTSIYGGSSYNFALYSSSKTALTLSNVQSSTNVAFSTGSMTNGTDIGYSTYTSIINVAGHKLVTGSDVLFSGTISPLVNQTTYYAIIVTTNSIKLALTSTDAVTGDGITLTSLTSQITPNTFTLTPLAMSGTPKVSWQTSNDNIVWLDLNVTTTSLVSPYTSTNTIIDMGTISERYLRAKMDAPATGSAKFTILINSR